jgi:prepilin-type N-terminal cleavage/methylation domain-containing protein
MMKRQTERKKHWITERGFTLIEVMIAIVVLMVGLIAVAQLVPASIRLNAGNRSDSAALVIAQRELDQMMGQPLTSTSFVDAQNNTCNLGNAATPNQAVGSPLLASQPVIDFAAGQVNGYSFSYRDPNDPNGPFYDIRWTVITSVNGGTVTGKRFIVGAVKRGGNGVFRPVTLDTMVTR